MRYALLCCFALSGLLLAACGMSDSGSPDPTAEPSPTGAALPLRVAQVESTPVLHIYGDGTWRCTGGGLDCLVLATPTTTPTAAATEPPAPTATATMTASATPPLTSTPRPTATALLTPIATSTPVPEVTPTQQQATPIPGTPVPTPQPKPSDCFAWVISPTGLNVRSSPSTEGVKLGSLNTNDRVEVFLVQVVQPEGSPTREEWGMIQYQFQTAWIALWHGGQELARLDDTAACWESTAAASTVQMCLGWGAVLPHVNKNDMAASFAIWADKKQCVVGKGVHEIDAPRLAISYGGIGEVRYKVGPLQNGDCGNPALPPNEAALDQANRHLPVAVAEAPPSQGFWIEVDNECDTIYFDDLVWLDSYLAAEIRVFSAYYPGRVVFGTMLAGGWTEARVRALRKTWEAALQFDACLGIHAGSPLKEYTALDGLRIDWLYKYSFQHRDIRRWLADLDPRYAAIPFCVTEWASGGGWSPYQPTEYYAWAREVRRDNILFAAVFTAGGWPYSVDGRMAETARLW